MAIQSRTEATANRDRSALFSAGFRPFFFFGAWNAVASLATWMLFLAGMSIGTQGWPPQILHAHEMVNGTVVAAIAGFLLTSVPRWCGIGSFSRTRSATLFGMWAAGRVALLLGDLLPHAIVAIVDASFLFALAWTIGIPIARSGKWRNLGVVASVLGIAAANVAIDVGWIGHRPALLRAGTYALVYAPVALLLVISGRLIPLFTRNAFRRQGRETQVSSWRAVGATAVSAGIAAMVLDLWQPGGVAGGALAALAAPLLVLRQVPWRPIQGRSEALLWILQAGHAWLAIGFACHAIHSLHGGFAGASALHAFTLGGMGSLILGIMARVSLGHTGRPIVASRLSICAFTLVTVAGAVRVFGPVFWPSSYLPTVWIAGALFGLAFTFFGIEFLPALWRPELDAD
ncbi:MAG: hypothetical protein CL910_07085 [Deltaproteobacteria bacterium]|jgi:uncharacterized protein involved in response to NO|nr:hypothetical protein [Deltaproteobacteria bacterium]